MAIVVVIPTCLPTYLPTCIPAYLHTYLPTYLRNKQAVIGRLPFWTLLTFFTDRGGGEDFANVIRPGSQAIMVHVWALSVRCVFT